MERIKKAVEQARFERRLSQDMRTPVRSGSTALSVEYTHTRRIDVSPKILEKNRIITGAAGDPATTAYKILRTQVMRLMDAHDWNALAITSPRAGEGKSVTAVNLAISIAREQDKTVLLVDLDLKSPTVHRCFDYKPSLGIGDYFNQDVPLTDILFNPGIERLVVLPGREPMDDSSELLSSPKMVRLVDEMKSRYPSRFVLFDLPPLMPGDDALAFSPYVDAALLVVEEGKTRREDVLQAVEMLAATNVIGTVLNKSAEKAEGSY